MMEPTMFISEIFDQVDFSTVMSSSVKIYKRKRDNLTSYNPHNGGPTWAQ